MNTIDSRTYEQVHEGMDVLDRDGDRIGKAGETLGRFFNVDAGFLGTKEYYIPFDAIMEVRDNAIWLNVDKDELESLGWDRRPEESESTGSGAGIAERERLQLREEELRARKTPVETGRVRLGKEVVEEQQTVEVPVTREEVVVERRPVERRPSDQPLDTAETETIKVPVREEQVEVEKQPVVYEEVSIGKRAVQDTQPISETVRREELRVDKEGDVDVRRDPGSSPA